MACVLAAMVLAGCAGPVRQHAVPKALTTQAVVPRLADVRYRAGIDREAFRREEAYLASRGHQGPPPPAVFLAVSGGGDNGAFGAGLLNGWTAAGNRPEFKLVTGVSTGALIAPFAFLGPAYDDKLKKFYTTTLSPRDILTARSFLAVITSDAMADNTPLSKLVEREGDQTIAIPGAFPPVMIDVEADGQRFQEMHVDGGTIAQVFVYPPSLRVKEIQEEHGRSLTPSTCGRCFRPASRWRRRATGGTRCPRATEVGAKQANEISVRGTRSGAPEA